jgi:glycerophosphoryl diester phosphodiesterase
VPTLQQVLNRYRDTRIIVEMKVDSEAMGLAVAADIRAADAVDRVCAAGFGARSLRAVRRALPEVATSACALEVRVALYRSWALWPVRHVHYAGYQVPEYAGRLRIVSPRFVHAARRAGLGVHVWTVDEQAEMERLLGWGVNGLISNRPHVAVRVRDAYCRQSSPALS